MLIIANGLARQVAIALLDGLDEQVRCIRLTRHHQAPQGGELELGQLLLAADRIVDGGRLIVRTGRGQILQHTRAVPCQW